MRAHTRKVRLGDCAAAAACSKCIVGTAHYPGLLGLTVQTLGCATHSGRAGSLSGPNGRLRCGRVARPKSPTLQLSNSRLLHAARSAHFTLVVVEGKAEGEGHRTAATLLQAGVPVRMIEPCAVAHCMGQVQLAPWCVRVCVRVCVCCARARACVCAMHAPCAPRMCPCAHAYVRGRSSSSFAVRVRCGRTAASSVT